MIVAGANPLAHCVAAAAGFGRLQASAVELDKQSLRRRACVAMHGMLDRHLIAELRRLDIDLRDHGAGRDQLAALGRPLRETCAEAENEIALGNQLVGDGRGKAAADAERPGISGKQAMAAHRRRQQRADAIGQREQRRLGIRNDGAAAAENERALRREGARRREP